MPVRVPRSFEKSFASHPRSAYWSKKNEDSPRSIAINSMKKRIFDCDKCSHEFESKLNNITSNETWCPYCSGRTLCGETDCKDCFKRSFASHEKSPCWSDNNSDKPIQCTISMNKKRIFNCDKCSHEFESSLNNISNHCSWCPYCSGNKLCGDTECNVCFQNSFAANPRSEFWSVKNPDKPIQCTIASGKTRIFNCNKCLKEFESRLHWITSCGSWCPHCNTKTESKLFEFLQPIYPSVISQFKKSWCKNKSCLPFDFCIPELKIIIELDGEQHFRQVGKWKSPEETQKRDLYKEKCATENSYHVIRLLQEDVWRDKYDWKNTLIETIATITLTKPQIIRICKNDEYNNHTTTTTTTHPQP